MFVHEFNKWTPAVILFRLQNLTLAFSRLLLFVSIRPLSSSIQINISWPISNGCSSSESLFSSARWHYYCFYYPIKMEKNRHSKKFMYAIINISTFSHLYQNNCMKCTWAECVVRTIKKKRSRTDGCASACIVECRRIGS